MFQDMTTKELNRLYTELKKDEREAIKFGHRDDHASILVDLTEIEEEIKLRKGAI